MYANYFSNAIPPYQQSSMGSKHKNCLEFQQDFSFENGQTYYEKLRIMGSQMALYIFYIRDYFCLKNLILD